MRDIVTPTYDPSYKACTIVSITTPFSGVYNVNKANGLITHHVNGGFYANLSESYFQAAFDKALEDFFFEYDFQQNNDFELLSLIGELDDLIATFTIKFWKTLSYGSINWGVLPLISDLNSLKSSFDDIFGNKFLTALSEFNERTELDKKVNFNLPSTDGINFVSFSGVLRLKGGFTSTLPSVNASALALFADELGVHPDLATIWNLIPLSFIVDYMFPVGDVLESLHPRGWFNPKFSFSGCASLKGQLTHRINGEDTVYKYPGSSSVATCYSRRTSVALDFSTKPPLFHRAPYKFGLSLRQLFNVGYVAKNMF